jgi:hypothetical protein
MPAVRRPGLARIAAVALCLFATAVATSPARAQPDSTTRKPFSLTAHRLDRCDSYLVIETSASRVSLSDSDWLDSHLLSHSLGLMTNVNANWAVGGVAELHLLRGHPKLAPAVRARRWFGREQSVELSVGYVPGVSEGIFGPVASVRYAPIPQFHVQAGVCRLHEPTFFNILQDSRPDEDRTLGFAGIGLSGAGGAAFWTVEAIALASLPFAVSRME